MALQRHFCEQPAAKKTSAREKAPRTLGTLKKTLSNTAEPLKSFLAVMKKGHTT